MDNTSFFAALLRNLSQLSSQTGYNVRVGVIFISAAFVVTFVVKYALQLNVLSLLLFSEQLFRAFLIDN